MTRPAVFQIYLTQIWHTKFTFFNLEKYHSIYIKITKITYQMTKTGSKEQHTIKL